MILTFSLCAYVLETSPNSCFMQLGDMCNADTFPHFLTRFLQHVSNASTLHQTVHHRGILQRFAGQLQPISH